MKQETKMKLRRAWEKTKYTVKEWAPWLAIGGTAGMIVGGYVGTLDNSFQIGKINKKLNTHKEVINHNADVLNARTDELRDRTQELQKQVDELQRQNNILMAKALEDTKGGPA